jgi:hypothetical protein
MRTAGGSADYKNNMEHGLVGKHGKPYWQTFALFLRLALSLGWHSALDSCPERVTRDAFSALWVLLQ